MELNGLRTEPPQANFYEALVGTLKAAKKRKVVDFKGEMLLKGMSDKVLITLAAP